MAAPGAFGFQGQLTLNNQPFMAAVQQAQQRLSGFVNFARGVGNQVAFGGNVGANLPQLQQSLARANTSSMQLRRSLDSMAGTLNSGLGIGVAIGALGLLSRGFTRAIERAREFQTITLSIAAAMQSARVIVNREDPTSPQYFSGAKAQGKNASETREILQLGFKKTLGQSRVINEKLIDRAAKNILTYEEQAASYLVGTPVASRKGLTQEQQMVLTEKLAVAAKVLGQKGQQVSNQVRVVMSGQNIPRSVLGANLGIGNEVKNMRGDEFYNYLMDRVKGFVGGEEEFENSIEGLLAQIESKIDLFAAKAGKKFAEIFSVKDDSGSSLKSKIDELFNSAAAERAAETLSQLFKNVVNAMVTIANSPAMEVISNFLEFLARFGDELLILGALRQLQRLLVSVAAAATAAGNSLSRMAGGNAAAPGIGLGALAAGRLAPAAQGNAAVGVTPVGRPARGARAPGVTPNTTGGAVNNAQGIFGLGPLGVPGVPRTSNFRAQQMAQPAGFVTPTQAIQNYWSARGVTATPVMVKGVERMRDAATGRFLPGGAQQATALMYGRANNALIANAQQATTVNGVPVGQASNLNAVQPKRLGQQLKTGVGRLTNSVKTAVTNQGGFGNALGNSAMRGSMAYMGWSVADNALEDQKARVTVAEDGSLGIRGSSGTRMGMNIAGGAATGAAFGSAFGPLGSAIGATVGVFGGLNAAINESIDAHKEYADAMQKIGDGIAETFLTNETFGLMQSREGFNNSSPEDQAALNQSAKFAGYKDYNTMIDSKLARVEVAARAEMANRDEEVSEKEAAMRADAQRVQAKFAGNALGPDVTANVTKLNLEAQLSELDANRSKIQVTDADRAKAAKLEQVQLPTTGPFVEQFSKMSERTTEDIAREVAVQRLRDDMRTRARAEMQQTQFGDLSDLAGAVDRKFSAGLLSTLSKASGLREQFPSGIGGQEQFNKVRDQMVDRYVEDFAFELADKKRALVRMGRSFHELADSSSLAARDISRIGQDTRRIREDFHTNFAKAGLAIQRAEINVAEAQLGLADAMRNKARAVEEIKLAPYQDNQMFGELPEIGMRAGKQKFQDELVRKDEETFAAQMQQFDQKFRVFQMGFGPRPEMPTKPGSFEFFEQTGFDQAKRDFGALQDNQKATNFGVLNAQLGQREAQIGLNEAERTPGRMQEDFARTMQDMAERSKQLNKTLEDNRLSGEELGANISRAAQEYARLSADFAQGQKIFRDAISSFDLQPLNVNAKFDVSALANVIIEGISPTALTQAVETALSSKLGPAIDSALRQKAREGSRTLQ